MLNTFDNFSNDLDPAGRFCMFYNLRIERRGDLPGIVPTHRLSLSLDEEGRRRFDGLRVMVVCEANLAWGRDGELPVVTDWAATSDISEQEISIKHKVLLAKRQTNSPLTRIPTPRTLYEAHRWQTDSQEVYLDPKKPATVLLELVAERRRDLPLHARHRCFILKPSPHSDTKTLLHAGALGHKVLYGRNFAIGAPDYARLIKLRCSWLYSQKTSPVPYFLARSTNLTYHIRILSLHPRLFPKVPLLELPPTLISRIILHALDLKPHYQTERDWATPLLSYALIRRSWVKPVESLFWKIIGSGRVPMLNLPALIRCLKAQPEHVRTISRFDFIEAFWYTRYFQGLYAENLKTSVARGFFWTATELREVTVDQLFLREAKEALAALKYVEYLRVVAEQDDSTGQAFMSGGLLSLCENLEVAQKWPSLEGLEINWWAEDRPGEDVESILAPYSLKDLRLIDGRLYGPELLHLTSKQPSTLTNLLLENIWCFSNSQFREFLLQVRGSLQKLELYGIEIDKVTGDEESALDSSISVMQRLTYLSASYGILTNRGICRKRPAPSGAILYVQDYLSTALWETPEDVGLTQAVEEGHWKEIHLTCSGHFQDYRVMTGRRYLKKQEDVMEMARRKCVRLTLPIPETAI